jgi:hypothetical protein
MRRRPQGEVTFAYSRDAKEVFFLRRRKVCSLNAKWMSLSASHNQNQPAGRKIRRHQRLIVVIDLGGYQGARVVLHLCLLQPECPSERVVSLSDYGYRFNSRVSHTASKQKGHLEGRALKFSKIDSDEKRMPAPGIPCCAKVKAHGPSFAS